MTAAGRREDPTAREAARGGAPRPAPEFALDAWRRTCDAVNGAGLGTTVAALESSGALQTLAEAEGPLAVSGWADRHGLNPPYAELAAFLLATQGWAERRRDPARGEWWIALTPAGRAWVRHAHVYSESIARLDLATELRARLSGEGKAEAPDWTALVRVDAAPGDETLATLLRRHVRGPLLASVLGGLFRAGVLARLARGPFGWAALDALELPVPLVAPCLRLLAEEGFVEIDDDLARLTPSGRVAGQWAALDDYVVSYARVYRNVPVLLGVPLAGAGDVDADGDRDRHLLLYGKSFVLFQGVHTALAEVVRPLFARAHAERPRFVLDPSAGDGSALVCVARAVAGLRRETGGRPLLFVGAAANALARVRCEAGLRAEGVPFRVVEGEIADPDALAARLAAQGLDLRDALVVNKGSFHGRRHRGVGHERIAPRSGEPSSAVFVTPGHELVRPEAMEDDLAACFARWARWVPRHGLVVADTHTVDPAIAAASCRENALGHVLSSHGWSHQYLIEVECFRRSAARAGLHARASVDLGSDRIARPTMSLEHLVPA